jgi:hypothetical protein
MTTYLTKEEILQADDIQYDEVPVPEWGGTVRIKTLTGEERDAFEEKIIQRDPQGNRTGMDLAQFRAKLLVRTMVDSEGKRIFKEQDIHELGRKSSAAMDKVFVKVRDLNRMTDEDVEELTQGFERGQSEDSISG